MNFRQLRNFLLILVIIAAPGLARAATVTETFTFNATLTSGDLLCGDSVAPRRHALASSGNAARLC